MTDIKKQITETKYDSYPLDRLLPRESVLKIFDQIYTREKSKGEFLFKDRKFQKLREGYWSLFAAKALDEIEQKEHLIVFPSDPHNDVRFLSPGHNGTEPNDMDTLDFDVKEFTKYSQNIETFIKESVSEEKIPSRERYGIIVGINENITDFRPEMFFMTSENDRGVFIVSSQNANDTDIYSAQVCFVYRNEVKFDRVLDVMLGTDMSLPILIYQNTLRWKN